MRKQALINGLRFSGKPEPYRVAGRREGDPSADFQLAKKLLGWAPAHSSLE